MAAGMFASGSFSLGKKQFLGPSSFGMLDKVVFNMQQRGASCCMCFAVEGGKSEPPAAKLKVLLVEEETSEKFTYVVAAVMSALGIIFMTVLAIYCKFSYQMEEGEEIHYLEMFGTFALSLGAAYGAYVKMGTQSLVACFVVAYARVPAIVFLAYGVFHKGTLPGICFGAGLGFTVLGIAYIFVHNGLVHKRFPVGPIANVPYLRKVAAAHQLHHMEKFKGVPYGLFLGPKEVEDVGGHEALEMEINNSSKSSASRASL